MIISNAAELYAFLGVASRVEAEIKFADLYGESEIFVDDVGVVVSFPDSEDSLLEDVILFPFESDAWEGFVASLKKHADIALEYEALEDEDEPL